MTTEKNPLRAEGTPATCTIWEHNFYPSDCQRTQAEGTLAMDNVIETDPNLEACLISTKAKIPVTCILLAHCTLEVLISIIASFLFILYFHIELGAPGRIYLLFTIEILNTYK